MSDANTLHIKNYFAGTVSASVTDDNWNCCDSPKPGTVVGEIPQNGQASLTFCRTDGHGCNGRQGQFQISIDSKDRIDLNFDSHGDIGITSVPTAFFALLGQNSDNSYTLVVGPN